MTALPHHLRYERKFIPNGLSLAEALAMVRRHPALFRQVYPERAVNNIYLDSSGLRDYFDHINGAACRVKTRIRWYGQFAGRIESPALERKVKRGLVSSKLACQLPPLSINGFVPRDVLLEALDGAGLPESVRHDARCLKPSLANRYQRRYFQSADGQFRLTVDSHLQFYSLRHSSTLITPLCCRSPEVIIELKFDPKHAGQAAPVTNAFPFRLTRCSKYVLGIQSMSAADF